MTSYVNQGSAVSTRGPPVYTGRHHVSSRASLHCRESPVLVKRAPMSGKGSPVSSRGLPCRKVGLLYRPGGLLYQPPTTGHPVSYILHPVTEGLLHTLDGIMCQPGPPYICRSPPALVKRGLRCRPEGLLYQAKGPPYRPGGLLCWQEGLCHAKGLLYRPGGLLNWR